MRPLMATSTVCLTNNAAERALRGVALGRRNWTFAGSQRGADRAAVILTVCIRPRALSITHKFLAVRIPL